MRSEPLTFIKFRKEGTYKHKINEQLNHNERLNKNTLSVLFNKICIERVIVLQILVANLRPSMTITKYLFGQYLLI